MLLYKGLGQGQSQSANSHFYWKDDEMLSLWGEIPLFQISEMQEAEEKGRLSTRIT